MTREHCRQISILSVTNLTLKHKLRAKINMMQYTMHNVPKTLFEKVKLAGKEASY